MSFSEKLAKARRARGWTQRELAAALDVDQRTVSTWEQGKVLPSPERQHRALELVAADAVSSRRLPTDARSAVSLPGRSTQLSFASIITPDRFEDFTADLMHMVYPSAEVHRVGTSGHKQDGFDLHVVERGKITVGLQCKHVARLGPSAARAVVAAAKTPVQQPVLVFSGIAAPAVRAEIRQHPAWKLWDANDLSRMVRLLPKDAALRIVETYFPGQAEPFLGHTAPSAWSVPAVHFERIERGDSYTHRFPLVGRQELLEFLISFATGDPRRIGILTAHGGLGKTRLLKAMYDELSARNPEVVVRILDHDTPTDAASFDLLPSEGRLIVIVDDAHDSSIALGHVVAGVLHHRPQSSVLMTARPYGVPQIRRELRNVGIDLADAAKRELEELTLDEAEQLARAVLGAAHQGWARRLAATAADCPLLIVAGAARINTGRVDPTAFEGDEDLRNMLLDALDQGLTASATSDSDQRHQVLQAVAALQPVHMDDPAFAAAIQQLVGCQRDEIWPHLTALEDAGILRRRGDTRRMVPDLLGDTVLSRAALWRAAGQRGPSRATGYLDRVLAAASGRALAHLIVNASRVDWQHRAASGPDLMESIWTLVDKEFRDGDAAVRVAVLKVLTDVAYFQPEPVLAIARWALEHPAPAGEARSPLGLTATWSGQDVRYSLAPVLESILMVPEYFSAAADLLWELGRDDVRPQHSTPEHPLRILWGAGAHHTPGATIFQPLVLACVRRWLTDTTPRKHSPLLALQPLLATEGHRTEWNDMSLTFLPYFIDPNPEVLARRAEVLDLAFAELRSQDPRRAVAAADTIAAAINGPRGGFGIEPTAEVSEPWSEPFAQTLQRLAATVAGGELRPAAHVAIRRNLQWLVDYGSGPLHEGALDVLAAIPKTPTDLLARALRGGPTDPRDRSATDGDGSSWERAREKLYAAAIAAIADWSTDDVAAHITKMLAEQRQATPNNLGEPWPFLWTLIGERPGIGIRLCQLAVAEPQSVATQTVSVALARLASIGDENAVSLARTLLTADDRLAQQVALAFGVQRGRRPVALDGEADLLRELVVYDDPHTRAFALSAISPHQGLDAELAVELLAAFPLESTLGALPTIAQAFARRGGHLTFADLPGVQQRRILDALAMADSIDDYQVSVFLADLAVSDPNAVVRVLMARVERAEQGRPPGFDPLPHRWDEPLAFRDHPQFPVLLREIREWIRAAPASPWRTYLGGQLFALVAGGATAEAVQVIDEYLETPDEARCHTIGALLRELPSSFAWDLPFVRRCLQSAEDCGAAAQGAIATGLRAAVVSGLRRGIPGQPFPEDVTIRDRAQAALSQCLPGTAEHRFYSSLMEHAEGQIEWATDWHTGNRT